MFESLLFRAFQALAVIGGLAICSQAIKLVEYLYICWKPSDLSEYRQLNAWAIVTGSSDGIGRGLAYELAAKGFNVIIHGRKLHKLKKVRSDILANYPGVKVCNLVLDVTKSQDLRKDVESALAGLGTLLDGPITVLVNCLGGNQPLPEPFMAFGSISPIDIDAVIDLNVRFPTHLTHVLLPSLSRDTPSLVLNIGGHAGILPMPYLNVYGAGKAFTLALSKGLAREMMMESRQIKVLNIHTGKVTSTSLFTAAGTLFEPSSRKFAESTLGKVASRRLVVCGYWPHALQLWMVEWIPEWVQSTIFAQSIRSLMARNDKAH
ncbi:MAG: hypothetical protein MMC23_010130 [Stictis urceolatum]|nr:hypothetical protein [Stictis urceolata]